MSSDGQDGGGVLFHQISSNKRKRRGIPSVFIYGAVAVLFVGAMTAWVMLKPRSPLWLLPEGQPSMSDAFRCLRHQEYDCAEADFFAYLKKYPDDAQATVWLAMTLTDDGRHEAAIPYYEKALKQGSAYYDMYAKYARSLDAVGKTDEAIKMNREALRIYPQLVDVRGDLAKQLVKKGKPKEALELLESYDRESEEQGRPPYFAAQIRQIKLNMGGAEAKEALAAQAEADAPVKAQAGEVVVKGRSIQGHLLVPVSVNGADAQDYIVDSGATQVSIPWSDAQALMKAGRLKPGDYKGSGVGTVANGAGVLVEVYNIRSLKVGDAEVKNVLVGVRMSGGGPRLLGQTFLKRFKTVSVDNKRGVLVLTR
jgi:predicted aspartyl protease